MLQGEEGGGEGGDEWTLGDGQEDNQEGLALSNSGNLDGGSTSDNSYTASASAATSTSDVSNTVNSSFDSDDDEGYVTALPDGGFAQAPGLAAQGQGLAPTPVFGGPSRLTADENSGAVKYKKGTLSHINLNNTDPNLSRRVW